MAHDSAKVTQALLAGRKLLLADDSITIQKVVALTFADEGVEVVSVSNGRDAIDRLAEFLPDVVLADAVMPQMNGYELCEYIKHDERLKHIPVMLLVGSFEPFDETEARRVGADDTLTKPFQSIRRLIEKVGTLLAGRTAEDLVPTAELPKAEVASEPEIETSFEATFAPTQEQEPERLSVQEIEVATADTQPLPSELRHLIEESAARNAARAGAELTTDTKVEPQMEYQVPLTPNEYSQPPDSSEDMPLDLEGIESVVSDESDDFVLDIDLDVPDDSAYQPSAYVRPPAYNPPAYMSTSSMSIETQVATTDQLAQTEEFPPFVSEPLRPYEQAEFGAVESFEQPLEARQQATTEGLSINQGSSQELSPAVIDAIAKRVVEQMSERVIKEIAWEVVPDLAELLIKRKLEEQKP